MVRQRAVPADDLERRVRPLPCPLERNRPGRVVGLGKAGEQASQRLGRRRLDLPLQVVAREDFGAAALQHTARRKRLSHDAVAGGLRRIPPARHAGRGLLAFGGRLPPLLVQHLAGRLRRHHVTAQLVGVALGQEDVKHRVVHAPQPSIVLGLRRPARPFVAQPEADRAALRRFRQRVHVQRQLAAGLGLAVPQSNPGRDLVHGARQQLLSVVGDLHFVLSQGRAPLPERPLPLCAGGSLDAVLVRHLHQDALGRHVFERVLHALAIEARVGRHVVHQQVGQRSGVGPNAQVRGALPGQLVDQEGQAAQVAAKQARFRVVVQLGNARGDLGEQHVRVDQVGRQRLEQVAGRNHGAHVPVGDPAQRIVKDAQLRPKLAVLACHCLEALLPEAPAGAEQRIVVGLALVVLASGGQLGAREMPRHLSGAGLEHAFQRSGGAGLLAQQHFASHVLDFGVGELNRDAKAVAEPL